MGARSYFLLDNEILSTDEMIANQVVQEEEHSSLLEGKTILVIDDNPINLSVAEKTLEKYGAECLRSASAKEGIAQYNSKNVDLILMDLHMPVIDGFEATRRIKESAKYLKNRIPVLAYTTYPFNEVKEAIESSGLDGYIGKPFTQTQVLDIILDTLS